MHPVRSSAVCHLISKNVKRSRELTTTTTSLFLPANVQQTKDSSTLDNSSVFSPYLPEHSAKICKLLEPRWKKAVTQGPTERNTTCWLLVLRLPRFNLGWGLLAWKFAWKKQKRHLSFKLYVFFGGFPIAFTWFSWTCFVPIVCGLQFRPSPGMRAGPWEEERP